MKYDMKQPLIGFNGKDIKKGPQQDPEDPDKMLPDDGSAVTLGETLSMACVNANPQKYQDGPSKLKVYRVLQKVGAVDAEELELTAEEITLLKALVGDMYGVAVVGAVEDILEKTAEH